MPYILIFILKPWSLYIIVCRTLSKLPINFIKKYVSLKNPCLIFMNLGPLEKEIKFTTVSNVIKT